MHNNDLLLFLFVRKAIYFSVVQEQDSARMQGQSLCLGAGIVPARVQVESLVGPGQGPVWSRVKRLAWLRAERLSPSRVTTLAQ